MTVESAITLTAESAITVFVLIKLKPRSPFDLRGDRSSLKKVIAVTDNEVIIPRYKIGDRTA